MGPPTVALATAAPGAAASEPPFICPSPSCLSAVGWSAPPWTATPAGNGSVTMNWTLGTYRQSCFTYDPKHAYLLTTPIAISVSTTHGHTYDGVIRTNPRRQPFAVSSTASPTLAANFPDYTFGHNSTYSNAVERLVY